MAYAAWSVSFGEQPSAAKWNILGTNDAYFDALVGSGTAWTSYTPTWTNLTVGNATQASAYQQFGKTVHVRMLITLGTTSTVGTAPKFSLPVTSSSAYDTSQFMGIASYTGAGGYVLALNWASTTTVQMNLLRSDATYTSINDVSATNPFAYASGYKFGGAFTYQAA